MHLWVRSFYFTPACLLFLWHIEVLILCFPLSLARLSFDFFFSFPICCMVVHCINLPERMGEKFRDNDKDLCGSLQDLGAWSTSLWCQNLLNSAFKSKKANPCKLGIAVLWGHCYKWEFGDAGKAGIWQLQGVLECLSEENGCRGRCWAAEREGWIVRLQPGPGKADKFLIVS